VPKRASTISKRLSYAQAEIIGNVMPIGDHREPITVYGNGRQ
jgi:hypothetical protein